MCRGWRANALCGRAARYMSPPKGTFSAVTHATAYILSRIFRVLAMSPVTCKHRLPSTVALPEPQRPALIHSLSPSPNSPRLSIHTHTYPITGEFAEDAGL